MKKKINFFTQNFDSCSHILPAQPPVASISLSCFLRLQVTREAISQLFYNQQ